MSNGLVLLGGKRTKYPTHVSIRLRLMNKADAMPWQRRRERERSGGSGWRRSEWRAICEHYGNKCLRCSVTGIKLVADHVVPLYRGGAHDLSNIQPLCARCNFLKGLRIVDYRPLANTMQMFSEPECIK